MDVLNFARKVVLSKIVKTWTTGQVQGWTNMKVGAAARAHGVHLHQYFTRTGTLFSKRSKIRMASIFTSPSCLATHTLKLTKEVGRRYSQVLPGSQRPW